MKIVNELTGAELFEVNVDSFEEITPELFKTAMADAGAVLNGKIGCLVLNGKNHAFSNVCVPVRMSYSEYKRSHSDCRTQKGSYNAADKTVVVYRGLLR